VKFTKTFIDYLKNFASINPQMYFREGKIQSTIVGGKKGIALFARAKTEIEIEKPFAILELHKLLTVLSIFTDPDVDVMDEKTLKISDERRTVNYTLTRPDFIKYAPDPDKFKVGDGGIKFKMTNNDFSQIMKVSATLKITDITFLGEEGKIYLMLSNYKDPTGDQAKIEISEGDTDFRAVVKGDNLKLVSSDYDVTIMPRGVVHFDNGTVEYFIPVEREESQI
jgi:hypothetical protein